MLSSTIRCAFRRLSPIRCSPFWAHSRAWLIRKKSGRSADAQRMQVCLLTSAIDRATITDGNLKYEGSLTIAADLMEKCGLIPCERILCSNMANGNRFETYAIPGDPGSGQIVLNGAAAFQGKRGDVLTIMSFAHVPKHKVQPWKPRVIVLGKRNRIVKERGI